MISPGDLGRASLPVSGTRFANFENPTNRNEGQVSRPPLLCDTNSTPGQVFRDWVEEWIVSKHPSVFRIVSCADLSVGLECFCA